MNREEIELMCEKIGQVQSYSEDPSCFGNIQINVLTPKNKHLYIISDRGEYTCFLKRKRFFIERLIPIHINDSLPALVDYLALNMNLIDNLKN